MNISFSVNTLVHGHIEYSSTRLIESDNFTLLQ